MKAQLRLVRLFWSVAIFSAGMMMALSVHAQVALPFVEHFDYTDGTALGSAGNGDTIWTLGNSIGTGGLTNRSFAALSYSGLAGADGLGVVIPPGGTSSRSRGVQFNPGTLSTSNPTVYVSFLLNVQTVPTTTKTLCFLRNSTGSGTPTAGLFVNTSGALTISKSSTTPIASTTAPLSPGTHLIVLRYKFATGSANDEVALWLDPGSLAVVESAVPPSSLSTTNGSDQTSLVNFTFMQASSDTGTFWVDELRIGLAWADVTPSEICATASINSDISPTNANISSGSTVSLNFSAGGSSPNYQWQVSTDGGATFNAATGSGANTTNFTTAPLAFTDNGSKFRCLATVACDGSSVTSSVATVTVINSAILSFRTAQNGDWNDTNTWQQSSDGMNWVPAIITPSSTTSNITVRGGHTVLVTVPVTADRLVIQANGEVDASGAVFTLTNTAAVPVDCDVFGTLQAADPAGSSIIATNAVVQFESGSQFIWNSPVAGNIPAATWLDGSACLILNGLAGTAPTGLNQSFYDFIWNWPGSSLCDLNGQLTTVRHDLTMTGASDSANSVRFLQTGFTCNLTIGGDFTIAGGVVSLSGGSVADTVLNIYPGGNFVIAAGATLDSRQGKLTSGPDSSANIIFTNTAVSHILTNAGAILHDGVGVGCPINWQVATGVTVTLSGNLPLGPANFSLADSVTVDGTLNLNGNQITGSGLGTLNVDAGGTLVGDGTNQLTVALGEVNYGGTLSLPGLPPLGNADSLQLFDALAYSGAFNAIIPATPGTGLLWNTAPLTINGILAVTTPGATGPVIRSAVNAGGNFILGGDGGTPLLGFHVLTSTTPALPAHLWTVEAAGQFDSNGAFSYTNAIDTQSPGKFYLLSVP